MYEIIVTELIKMKRSKFLLIIPGIILCNLVFGFSAWKDLYIRNSVKPGMDVIFDTIGYYMNTFIVVFAFAILSAYIFSREYRENTANSLFTCPVSRLYIFFGKVIVLLCFIVVTVMLVFAILLLLNCIVLNEIPNANFLLDQLKIFAVTIIMQFLISQVFITISLLSKNYVAPVIFAALSYILGIWFSNFSNFKFYPIQAILNIYYVFKGPEDQIFSPDFANSIISVVLTFTIPFIFNVFYFMYSDVKS